MSITSYFYNVLAFISSIIMIYAKSPVRSVLSLISTFFFVTFSFLHLNINFVSLVLLLVYLGAVVVMFLILVMFINIRIYKTTYLEVFSIRTMIILLSTLILFFSITSDVNFGLINYKIEWFNLQEKIGLLSALCFHVFNLFSLEIYFVVLLLLISMIASMSIVFIEVQNMWKV